eukprot:GHVP01070308.1.p1 GENE.GHVP01070308.1~~GHVP01070308.1.p1  ORF type:complete len:630 (+),score=82.89 GHVP01070308.1:2083-3972(+)
MGSLPLQSSGCVSAASAGSTAEERAILSMVASGASVECVNMISQNSSSLLRASDPGVSALGNQSSRFQQNGSGFVLLRPRIRPTPPKKHLSTSDRLRMLFPKTFPIPILETTPSVQCSICSEVLSRPGITPCGHIFCMHCILKWLSTKSMCPICRVPLYISKLVPLRSAKTHAAEKVNSFHEQIPVECPKCSWNGFMKDWESHDRSQECYIYRNARNGRSTAKKIQFNLPDPAKNTDGLVEWLKENKFQTIKRIFVVKHNLENTVGAAAGHVIGNMFEHWSLILEFVPLTIRSTSSSSNFESCHGSHMSSSSSDSGTCNKENEDSFDFMENLKAQRSHIFLTMETSADHNGINWGIQMAFPKLRPSAIRIDIYEPAQKMSNIDLENFIIAHPKQYHLLVNNCQDFARSLLRTSGAEPGKPVRSQQIYKPLCRNGSLDAFLKDLQETGGPSGRKKCSVHDHYCELLITKIIVTTFDAEDLHRQRLVPFAVAVDPSVKLWKVGGIKSASNQVKELCEKYDTHVILVLEISQCCPILKSKSEPCLYLSLELRSDVGLVYHSYTENPPGLKKSAAEGGPRTQQFASSRASLETLTAELRLLRNRRYDSTSFSSWEFAKTISAAISPAAKEDKL